VRPGSGGTWWDNSALNTQRDGNAAASGDVYTGGEQVIKLGMDELFPELMFLGAAYKTSAYWWDSVRMRSGMDAEDVQDLLDSPGWVSEGLSEEGKAAACRRGSTRKVYRNNRKGWRVVIDIKKGVAELWSISRTRKK